MVNSLLLNKNKRITDKYDQQNVRETYTVTLYSQINKFTFVNFKTKNHYILYVGIQTQNDFIT